MCIRKIQHQGACREANTARGEAECCICLETPSSAVFFVHTSIGGALRVVLLGAIFLSTRIASIFSDQTISELLYILLVVAEQTGRISLVSFSI